MKRKKILIISAVAIFIMAMAVVFQLDMMNKELLDVYKNNLSLSVADNSGHIIYLSKNSKGYYAEYLDSVPDNFINLLLKKEDRFFYWHFGFNAFSILEAMGNKFGLTDRKASSTISQQLAKILLEKENQRNLQNKFRESFYTLALELFNKKADILKMYANSAYFGNQFQGIESASEAYFNSSVKNLTIEETVQLLATINSPTDNNPAGNLNTEKSRNLAEGLKVSVKDFTDSKTCQNNIKNYLLNNQPIPELQPYISGSSNININLTVDSGLTEKIREITAENMSVLKDKKAKNAAVVVLSVPDNKILSIIGSADPASYSDGNQIDMSRQPRQIGSTIKPFIYMKGFQKGMRPYTLIDDREYKYLGPGGYPFYPKNYDFKYHGIMTAHYALDNSINVAAVKTLDFVGVENFNDFLVKDLGYKPVQPIDQYQLGIAMGSLEMNLLDLSHYFTIFPNEGKLSSLKISDDNFLNNKFFPSQNITVSSKPYIELINKILSDRKTGVDQFGAESSLNLAIKNYALKTGTSHDYTDSWIVGYTPDFLVGVWVGNADNTPTDAVSGQVGSGRIWNQVMQLILNSKYNKNSQFNFSDVKEYQGKNGVEFGLAGDDFNASENIILDEDKSLILNPHDGDVFLYDPNAQITLKCKEECDWKINGKNYAKSTEIVFKPPMAGKYEITATSPEKTETVNINFVK